MFPQRANGASKQELSKESARASAAKPNVLDAAAGRHLQPPIRGCRVSPTVAAAQRAGLMPVLCVGETLDERRAGAAIETVIRQLDAVLDRAGVAAFSDAMLAYEPVWAIGTGVTATPADAQEMHAAIRERVATRHGSIAERLPILYGGSVKAGNAAALFDESDVDGGLVGGASLDAREFALICNAA